MSKREGYDLALIEVMCDSSLSIRREYLFRGGEILERLNNTLRLYVPTKQDWTGTGQPPVGTICEVHHDGRWYETTIIGKDPDDGSLVFKTHGDYDSLYDGYTLASCFRPIRTPEQLAAEERESHVNAMLCHDALGGTRRGLAEALYDAGYRKTEANK